MKKKYNKIKFSTIALILTLTLSAIMASLPLVSAPLELPAEIPTFLYTSVSPNPVGLNQICYVQAIFTHPLQTSRGNDGDRHEDVTIEITEPDGNKIVLGPFVGGMTGGVATSFIPTKVGEYTLKSVYPGQVSTLTNPYNDVPGGYHPELIGSTFLPSESPPTTLTVQEEPVGFIYQTPSLPDYYWTRPIYATNWDWGTEIGSNWFGLDQTGFTSTGKYDIVGNQQPDGTAPNSPHIMWTKPTHFGGQPGGPIPSDQGTQFTSTSVVIRQYDGSIIMGGILYYVNYAGHRSDRISWEAVDLRTGETIWSRPAGITGNERLHHGQIFRFHNVQEFGSVAYLYSEASGGVIRVYDAFSGAWQCNITDARNLDLLVSNNNEHFGTQLGYYTSGGNLTMWNSTKLFEGRPGRVSVRSNTEYNWTNGITWSVPLPTELNGEPINLGLYRVTPEVLLLRQIETFSWQGTQFGWVVVAGVDALTGELLWGPFNQTRPFLKDISTTAARDGYWFEYDSDTHEAYAYSLTTGQKVWGPIEVPYDVYSSQNVWAEIAYGKVYFNGGGGIVNCMDLATGNLEWSFSRGTSGYDTPFGVYPIFGYRTQVVADGKLFLQEGYTYTPPLHPARELAIDCETGDLVWSILHFGSRQSPAIADGYLVDWNSYDCQIYVYGKGPTETTATASPKVSTLGSSVLIEGTVMDHSAGTKQSGIPERFPNGVPAVSDESQREWMEYVYMQQNQPWASGVPVKLEVVVDPNGNWYDIGTAMTDSTGFYSLDWQPPVPGRYLILASFEGSESYYGSYVETAIVVDEAPALASPMEPEPSAPVSTASEYTTPEPNEPTAELPFITTEIAIIAAVAVASVIGAVAFWALKKRE